MTNRDNTLEELAKKILQEIYQRGMIRTWYRDKPDGWDLVSGLWSPFYINLRRLASYPQLLRLVGEAMGSLICRNILGEKRIIGIATAGIPIAVATSLSTGLPSGMTRKFTGVKTLSEFEKMVLNYGEHAMVETELKSGDTIVLLDDLVTGFDSKLVARAQIQWEIKNRSINRISCKNIAVVFDRGQGAQEKANQCGMSLHSLIPFKSRGLDWLIGHMKPREIEVIRGYIDDPNSYQDPELQHALSIETKGYNR